jgi:hypothetical protein
MSLSMSLSSDGERSRVATLFKGPGVLELSTAQRGWERIELGGLGSCGGGDGVRRSTISMISAAWRALSFPPTDPRARRTYPTLLDTS